MGTWQAACHWRLAGISLIRPTRGNPAQPVLESTSTWSSRQAGCAHSPIPTLASLQLSRYGMVGRLLELRLGQSCSRCSWLRAGRLLP